MNISMDLHQQILAQARDTALQEAAGACNYERKDAVKHQMPLMALGALACRRHVEALRATPAPGSPAVRIAELEAALREIRDMTSNPDRHFSGPSPEDEEDATIDHAEFVHLQEIAAAALSTPN